jgi:hypothetical protein
VESYFTEVKDTGVFRSVIIFVIQYLCQQQFYPVSYDTPSGISVEMIFSFLYAASTIFVVCENIYQP